jgi:DNA-binding transcriptional LysR family regulator
VGHLRTFETVARHRNYRLAADELALTQSAVSRQIQSFEEELGVRLFARHTRAVELTSHGVELLASVGNLLSQLDLTVRQIRHKASRQTVSITTFASLASMWLIPRLEMFQRAHPEIDIRVEASDTALDLEAAGVDIALRYGPASRMPAHAVRLFGEQLTPMASPWLLKNSPPVRDTQDLKNFTLIESIDASHTHLDWLTWQRWLESRQVTGLQPKQWLHFNYAYQMVQAAMSGQGVVLARLPMVAESLANGDLVEVLPQGRIESPMGYWLIMNTRSTERPEIDNFSRWLKEQACATRQAIGES